MKKLQILNGSPRRKGNSYFLSNLLMDNLHKEKIAPDSLYLYDYNIKPCIDCRYCKKGSLECYIKDDDMPSIYTKLEDSEIIIMATPIYWSGPTAKMKLLIDRLRPYYANKKLKGKKAALLLPAGSGKSDCDLTIEMYKRIFKELEIEYLGAITVKAFDIGDAKDNTEATNYINELAGNINKYAEMN
jgi:multimeric flavodoxin WrbA